MKPDSGGAVEFLLLENAGENRWWSMMKPGKRLRPGSLVQLNNRAGEPTDQTVTIIDKNGQVQYNEEAKFSSIHNHV